MTKYEILTVLRSMKLALKNGTKEDVQELVDTLIDDVEGERKATKE